MATVSFLILILVILFVLSRVSAGYFLVGAIVTYFIYGDVSLTMISTWLHIWLWPFFLLWTLFVVSVYWLAVPIFVLVLIFFAAKTLHEKGIIRLNAIFGRY